MFRQSLMLLAVLCPVYAQTAAPYLPAKLSAPDRDLFTRIAAAELETMWSAVVAEGYPLCFIHELDPIHPDRKLIGRARTIRYLPNRKDVRDKVYGAGPQLNYKGSEEAEPGDILVFDAGGETRSAVTGVMTTTRFAARGGVGMIADGAFRDVPGMAAMPIQVYMRRGQAASVSPGMMSIDYQTPVRIGGVTVIPGDILVGERHGILVIPAAIVEKVLEKAMSSVEREEFQHELLEKGEPIYGVYPRLNEANQKRFEQWRRNRKR
ncbi:MAG: hypothetical protein R2762_16850 [Bryobacteraceae bacterium]